MILRIQLYSIKSICCAQMLRLPLMFDELISEGGFFGVPWISAVPPAPYNAIRTDELCAVLNNEFADVSSFLSSAE